MKLAATKLCLGRSSKGPLGLNPIKLTKCSDNNALCNLQPTNVDAKGRILPSHAMIQSSKGNCLETRSKLQVDGMTAPAVILWSCNGDFNQGFAFRWNGQIRSLGECLTVSKFRAGARVSVEECQERQSGLGLAAIIKVAGKSRKMKDNQSWRLLDDGRIKKRGTKLCLSVDPNGHTQIRFDKLNLIRGLKPKQIKAKPGSLGSLFTLEKCAPDKLQQWTVSNK